MGCSSSSNTFKVNTIRPGQGKEVYEVARKLRIVGDVNRLFGSFSKMDFDLGGTISIHEFIVMNKVACELFGEMVFKLLDRDNSGSIDFLEYLIAIWNFCRLCHVLM